jgi:hypothetical protein
MSLFVHIETISEAFRFFQLEPAVQHPLVTVMDFSKVKHFISENTKVSTDFYSLIFKNYNRNNVKYGRKILDFQDGSLICLAPNQVLEMDTEEEVDENMQGWGLFFHPDLIRASSLQDKIKEYSFFSYEVSEALHLSEKERQILSGCVEKIETELQENIDAHSQAILISSIELLLNYCTRFYARQFITRKSANHSVVAQIEKMLSENFEGKMWLNRGYLPSNFWPIKYIYLPVT